MLISIAEYAAKVGRDPATIRQRILRGALPAQKIGRNWCIDSETEMIDHRERGKKNNEETDRK